MPESTRRDTNLTSRNFYNILKLKEFFEAVAYCLVPGPSEIENKFHGVKIMACPGATGFGYATVFTAYECLAFHHRILTCQVWARGLGQGIMECPPR